jgi:transcription initiation factor IIE alpha subunit
MSQLLDTVLFLRNSPKSVNLSATHRLVLIILAGRIGKNTDTWITQRILAKECAIKERQLQYILQDLREQKLISCSLAGRSNRYQLSLESTHCSASIIPDTRTVVRHNTRTVVRQSCDEKIAASPVVEPKNRPLEKPKEKVKVTIKAKEKEFVLPECINKNDWADLLKYRKEIRKPLTAVGIRRTVKRLLDFQSAGQNIGEMIDQTISNGWTGIFEVKKKKVFVQPESVVATNRYANLTDYTEIRLAKERENAGTIGNPIRHAGVQSIESLLSQGVGMGGLSR